MEAGAGGGNVKKLKNLCEKCIRIFFDAFYATYNNNYNNTYNNTYSNKYINKNIFIIIYMFAPKKLLERRQGRCAGREET